MTHVSVRVHHGSLSSRPLYVYDVGDVERWPAVDDDIRFNFNDPAVGSDAIVKRVAWTARFNIVVDIVYTLDLDDLETIASKLKWTDVPPTGTHGGFASTTSSLPQRLR
jgi:hypothetical protein